MTQEGAGTIGRSPSYSTLYDNGGILPMIYQDVNWMRGYAEKLCPVLRKQVLGWYRPARYTPCFFNKAYTTAKKKLMKISVIVQLEENTVNTLPVQSLAHSAGCSLQKDLPLIHSFSTRVNVQSLQALVQNKAVKKIWFDGEIKAVLDVASPTVGSDQLWNEGLTGEGIVIAVLDTGIYNHPDFSGRIKGFKDFVKNKATTYDDNGHGTHVAGCAAASGKASGNRYKGPAPKAGLVGVKVLNKVGSGSLSTVIQGIQWCIYNKGTYDIRVINLSLGSDAYQSYKDDPVCMAVEKAWDAGIVVCVAAGNSGPEAKTINSPAHHPGILTVGAVHDQNTKSLGDDNVAQFSSRGPTIDGLVKPDVIAPGVNIVATRSPQSFIDKQNKNTRVDQWHTVLSGTSMATPVCAGVVAQLLQNNDTLTPDQVKAILMKTARKINGFDENQQGAGVVDGLSAYGKLL